MTSITPELLAFSTKNKRKVLSQEQLDILKAGTYRILQDVGVKFPSKIALNIFSEHGADVDWDTQIVKLKPDLVDKALKTAPRSFTLGGREERFDLLLDGNHSYLCTDGCGTRVIDLETRQERSSRKEDVARMARITDALPLLGFFWPLVSAQDHGMTAPLHECHAGLTNTLKHVRGGTTVFPELARYLVEMATVVSGSAEERHKRPPICANICGIAPLAHDEHGIESALVYAEAGIPMSFMSMPTMGSTAPATPWGALVSGDAETVSAMVLIQLAYPGAPVIHSIEVSLMHPRTGGYVTGVDFPFGTSTVEIAHNWKVPSLGGGGGSMLLYPEQIILDHELCFEIYQSYRDLELKEEDLALDVIKSVGPGSHFLREKHTRQHIRDFTLGPLTGEIYLGDERRPSREVALEEFNKINETHHPEPLPDDKLKELEKILAAADQEAEKLST